MDSTLAEAVAAERVGFDRLHERYGPVLNLVDVLIGVVPNCDPYLEIWPVGFRTYNLMVPNFLNLPLSLIAPGFPKDVVGLGMYTSSRAASCAYCSAHTCSFALRRGSSADAVTGAERSPAEAAAVAAAEALSTMPHRFRPQLRTDLERHFSPGHTEWIVMGVAMMGFLNKFMDAMGVELEASAVDDVADLITPTGWAVGQHDWDDPELARRRGGGGLPPVDSARTMLTVARNAPGAVRLDRRWMDGMPSDAVAARSRIADEHHWDEPVLSEITHTRPRRALAAMLRHNLDVEQSTIGIGAKALVGATFAAHAGAAGLAPRAEKLAVAAGVDPEVFAVSRDGGVVDGLGTHDAAVIELARATSPSPATVSSDLIERSVSTLGADGVVEVVVWVSVCQLLHRLALWYDLD